MEVLHKIVFWHKTMLVSTIAWSPFCGHECSLCIWAQNHWCASFEKAHNIWFW